MCNCIEMLPGQSLFYFKIKRATNSIKTNETVCFISDGNKIYMSPKEAKIFLQEALMLLEKDLNYGCFSKDTMSIKTDYQKDKNFENFIRGMNNVTEKYSDLFKIKKQIEAVLQ